MRPLTEYLGNPSAVAHVSPEEAQRLLVEVASVQAQIGGLGMALAARIGTPAPTPASDRLLTLAEVGERIGTTEQFVRTRLVQTGELATVRTGRYVRVAESTLTRWQREKEDDGR